ncbi:MAG: VWA domain-containing protein [Pseudomonadota bacterium]
MNETLSRFLEALRHADLRISTAELLDAYRTVDAVGISSRQLLKDALALSVAKSADEQERFDEAFEKFFAHIDVDLPSLADQDSSDGAGDDAPENGGEPGEGNPAGGSALEEFAETGQELNLLAAMSQAAREVGLDRMWLFTQKNLFTRRILDEMGLAAMERRMRALDDAAADGDDGAGDDLARLAAARARAFEMTREYVEREFDLFASDNAEKLREERLRDIRLQSIDSRDQERVRRILRRIAKRLIALYSRKRSQPMRGVLDVRKTLRRNYPNDGHLFELHWRRKRVKEPDVMIICDVSRSVAALSRFLLYFVYSLNEIIPKLRSFMLCSDLVESTDLFDSLGLDEAIEAALKRVMLGSTDYGQALDDFDSIAVSDISRRTSVIILGDARSNDTNPRIDLMQKIHDRAKFVMWLNPEPRTFWGTGDSEMYRYLPYVHFARPTSSVRDLERAATALLATAMR